MKITKQEVNYRDQVTDCCGSCKYSTYSETDCIMCMKLADWVQLDAICDMYENG